MRSASSASADHSALIPQQLRQQGLLRFDFLAVLLDRLIDVSRRFPSRQSAHGGRVTLSAYLRGRISIEEFERSEERRLLAEVGRSHPVPEGWEPLPPCEHDWVDITRFGAMGRELLCARCGDERFEP